MNPELEQLVEYALVDSYITDKERQVLINKARKLGYDVDELEMILDAKLSKLNVERQEASPLKKCPSCGEVLKGLSMVCEACDYVVDNPVSKEQTNLIPITDTINRLKRKINPYTLGEKTRGEYIGNVICYIIFTGGIYLIYKAVKWEPLFAEEDISYKESITDIANLISGARRSYGKDPEIEKILSDFEREAASMVRKRRFNALRRGLTTIIVIAAIIVLPIVFWPKSSPSAEDMVKKYINEKNIGRAKEFLPYVDNDFERMVFESTIKDLEMDSLVNKAKNYDAALKIANEEKNTLERDEMTDDIIQKQVKELIVQKDFKNARERAALATYSKQSYLESQIKLAEKLDK